MAELFWINQFFIQRLKQICYTCQLFLSQMHEIFTSFENDPTISEDVRIFPNCLPKLFRRFPMFRIGQKITLSTGLFPLKVKNVRQLSLIYMDNYFLPVGQDDILVRGVRSKFQTRERCHIIQKYLHNHCESPGVFERVKDSRN